ncbi:MAG: membrane protein insertion efficiency factor YidD [archaeon]
MRFNIGYKISEFLIKFHQKKISPYLNKNGIKCRFYPTCSEYGLIAIKKYGFIRGWIKTIKRIRRCRPDNYETCIDCP